eukprot:1192415-Prorocentrum_minimum.AAC.4
MESAQWTNSAPAPLKTGADAPGERIIAATRRPDGTMRKSDTTFPEHVFSSIVRGVGSRSVEFVRGMSIRTKLAAMSPKGHRDVSPLKLWDAAK